MMQLTLATSAPVFCWPILLATSMHVFMLGYILINSAAV